MKKVACAVLPIVKKKEGEEAYGKFRRCAQCAMTNNGGPEATVT